MTAQGLRSLGSGTVSSSAVALALPSSVFLPLASAA
jgi:hypothetical protein